MSQVLRILYVDDDPDICAIVRLSLGLDPAIETRIAGSGAEALAMLTADCWQPDAILLDVMMPGMDGPALLQRLREQPRLADTPVMFMTAKARDADLEFYRSRGAIGAIVKPFDPIELPLRVREMLGEAAIAAGAQAPL